jgi:PHD/YefM family antitoxin component YafN of YafNO toxin-antitoxin module
MADAEGTCSLNDLRRFTRSDVRKLESSGRPVVLTVNGRPELVIQSAKAYQQLLNDRDLLNSLRRIRRGLDQARRGEGRPARAVVEDLAKKHAIKLWP